jgi:hypothetical protein
MPSSRTKKALLFYLGALLGIGSHCQLMSHTAIASAYIPLKYAPSIAGKLYIGLVLVALLGSALLVVTSWWRSVYRERSAPLFTTVLTGVAAFLVVDAVGRGHYDASWLALVMIGVVLFAGIDSARALRREWAEGKKQQQEAA